MKTHPRQNPDSDRGSRPLPFRRTLASAAIASALLGGTSSVQAQSDNFDAASLGSQWAKYQFFAQKYDSVPSGSGRALRIQANPVPGAAPAAAAITQTNVYTDFYVALDVVNWANSNQALVLLGQWTPGGADGLTGGTGMIFNYNPAQAGDNPGNRKGGQLQINSISPGFAAATKSVAEMTLEPGRSYRLVFQAVGTIYTGRIYDLSDLTTPIATIKTDDSTYSTGQCGFLSFSRNGTVGVTDVTIDNYVAAATDPNTAPAPAHVHPIAGTPIVVTRTPTARYANLHPAGSGISFQARTFTAGQINAAATKLFLNGTDASGSLAPLPANASTVNFSTAAGTLKPNALYSAQIILEDTTGTLKSTNQFWFDTFTDAFLKTAPVLTVEAEDYNYDSGKYLTGVIPVSGIAVDSTQIGGGGVGYYSLIGTPDIDFAKPGGYYSPLLAEYRADDRVQITQGSVLLPGRREGADIADMVTMAEEVYRIHDTRRSQYAAVNLPEYQVRLTSPGDWMNYTRDFPAGSYNVYLRCGSYGATQVHLEEVTSNPTLGNQTTTRLGTFEISNHVMRLNYLYEPLMSGGSPAVVTLSGTKTLRLAIGGEESRDARLISLDYLVLIPAPAVTTVYDNFNDGNDTTNPVWQRYDPIGGLTAPPATFAVTGGRYRLNAPAQQAPNCDAGPARAGSFIKGLTYGDFYVSADLIDFDDTVRQAFGVAARVTTPGLGTTGGYLFSWEPGSGTLPGETNGDLDISLLVDEAATRQIETAPSGLHLRKGRSYRFVFMGSGNNFEARVYELPDLTTPLIILPATDPDNTYPEGLVGLIAASNGVCETGADSTWDNFVVTTAEPKLGIALAGSNATLTWPEIPYVLQTSPSLTAPVWTSITTGITQTGGQNSYTVPASGNGFYRLIYP
jgi:hypothetical protein